MGIKQMLAFPLSLSQTLNPAMADIEKAAGRVRIIRPEGWWGGEAEMAREAVLYSGALNPMADHRLYAFTADTDVAVMLVSRREEYYAVEIARITWAQLDVYADNVIVDSFPAIDGLGMRAGYFSLHLPKE